MDSKGVGCGVQGVGTRATYTWDWNKDAVYKSALLLSETLRERVTLEYSLTLTREYPLPLSLTPVA